MISCARLVHLPAGGECFDEKLYEARPVAFGIHGPRAVPRAAELANFPTRPVRVIVPQSPGASTDLTARMMGQKLSEGFRQPVVIENRPGSSGIAGTDDDATTISV